MGVGVGLCLVPIELRHTEAWREDLCVNGLGEGGEAKLFESGINRVEGLPGGLLRRPFPSVTPTLPSFVLGGWRPAVMPWLSSPPPLLLWVRLWRFLPVKQMVRRAHLNELPVFIDV